MLTIEIHSTDIKVKSGVSAATNKPYEIREQVGYYRIPGEVYPRQIRIALEDDAAPYAVGLWEISGESFYVNKYEQLNVGRLKLINHQPVGRTAGTGAGAASTAPGTAGSRLLEKGA